MHLRIRLVLGVPLAALFITAGCASNKGMITYTDIPECPGFQITQPSFTITPTEGSENLGGNNVVSWDAGAVTAPQTYTVSQLMIGTKKIAGIRVMPASPSNFTAEVRVKLNYASCNFSDPNRDLKMARAKNVGSWQEVPSTQDKAQKFVEAVVASFSDWAIAD